MRKSVINFLRTHLDLVPQILSFPLMKSEVFLFLLVLEFLLQDVGVVLFFDLLELFLVGLDPIGEEGL